MEWAWARAWVGPVLPAVSCCWPAACLHPPDNPVAQTPPGPSYPVYLKVQVTQAPSCVRAAPRSTIVRCLENKQPLRLCQRAIVQFL